MYYVYFSTNKPEKAKKGWKTTRILFPIAPAEITTKVSGMNQTVNLINESEVNRIKGQKLTDISFDLRLPNQKYPFALYEKGEYKPAEYFLDKLKAFKKKNIPFKLWIIRKKSDNTALFDTKLDVTLESYEIKETTEDGFDVTVSVSLKTYKQYGITKIKLKKAKTFKYRKMKVSYTKKKILKSYTTKKGDTLHNISIKAYGTYTADNAKAIYTKNAKKLAKALSKKGGRNKSKSKRCYVTALPKGLKLSIPQKGG